MAEMADAAAITNGCSCFSALRPAPACALLGGVGVSPRLSRDELVQPPGHSLADRLLRLLQRALGLCGGWRLSARASAGGGRISTAAAERCAPRVQRRGGRAEWRLDLVAPAISTEVKGANWITCVIAWPSFLNSVSLWPCGSQMIGMCSTTTQHCRRSSFGRSSFGLTHA